ncbi:hypothetical protein KAU45_05290 [bacterium]|nr:hypothetical protein [bacterium]
MLATEVMIATPAVRSLIRDGKEHQLYSVIQAGQSHGMHTLNSSLFAMVEAGLVDREVALETSNRREELAEHLAEAPMT